MVDQVNLSMERLRTRSAHVTTSNDSMKLHIRMADRMRRIGSRFLAGLLALGTLGIGSAARADTTPVQVLDPNLQVTTVLSGLSQPIGIVFLGSVNDYFVLEKASGLVKRVINGVIQPTPVLDLAVNSNSERGLLSLVLHPNFPATPCVYIRWTESTTGADSNVMTTCRCWATASTASSGTAYGR